MGCGSSSGAAEEGSFAASEQELRRQLKSQIAQANPLSEEQVLARLRFEPGCSLKATAELIERAPARFLCTGERSELLLDAVKFCVSLVGETDGDAVQLLIGGMLKKGADPNVMRGGSAALHLVGRQCGDDGNQDHCLAALEALLADERTQVNLADGRDGDTAAHLIGRMGGKDKLLAILQQHGCDLTVKNNRGEKVSDAIASGVEKKHAEQVSRARAVCFKAAKGDTTASLEKAVVILKQAAARDGVDYINAPVDGCPDKMTLLGIAARDGTYVKTVQVLLAHGADPAVTDGLGNLPQFYLANRPVEYAKLVQQLLASGAKKASSS